MKQMQADIAVDVEAALIQEFGFKARGDWLQNGRCPSCGKKELYGHRKNPWSIRCGRQNNCGYEAKTRDLYPDLFESYNKRYPPTQTNPNATADAYLTNARELDISRMKGWYSQEKFWHPDADTGTATVRFPIAGLDGVYFERFVESVTITDKNGEKETRKANFKGAWGGHWWQPPGMKIGDNDEIWITEGVLDACALYQNGIKAVAVLSSVNYPEKEIKKHPHLRYVWALDNDTAGKNWTVKHVERMRRGKLFAAAAQAGVDDKADWNDLHKKNRLKAHHREEYRYHGAVLISKSPTERACLIYGHTEQSRFYLTYQRRTYWFQLDLEKFRDAYEQIRDRESEKGQRLTDEQRTEKAVIASAAITEIMPATVKFLYFQEDQYTDDSHYYARVEFGDGDAPINGTFTGAQISSAAELKKRLNSFAPGAVYTGKSSHLDAILKHQLKDIRRVKTIDFIGYDTTAEAYIYPRLAVKDGQLIKINQQDYFELGERLNIKTTSQVDMEINTNASKNSYDWVESLCVCFGGKGLAVLAFWFGSIFVNQIRQNDKSFAFLQVTGKPGSGKSTLVEFCWKLLGRDDYEGLDPNKASKAGIARSMAQTAGMPVAFIESDRERNPMDWDQFKTAYNGRSVSHKGVKNSGNTTYDPPFRGAMAIIQNDPIDASDAMRQRLMPVDFTLENHSEETRKLAARLEQYKAACVSYFLVDCLIHEPEITQAIKEKTGEYTRFLLEGDAIKNARIAKNHGQLMACLDGLTKILPIPKNHLEAGFSEITQMAINAQNSINADHPKVQSFWDTYEYLNARHGNQNPSLNHAKDQGLIAINIPHCMRVFRDNGQAVEDENEIKRLLKNSKRYKYEQQKPVHSKIEERTIKCWVFKNPQRSNA